MLHRRADIWIALPSHRAEGLTASASLHVLAFLLIASVPVAPPASGSPALVLTEVSEDTLTGARADAGADGDPGDADRTIEEPAVDGRADRRLEVDGLEVDVEKIRRRRDTLFPFVTAPLPFLDDLAERFRRTPGRLVNPFGRERRAAAQPPLQLGAAGIQRVVDAAWSRRDRWRNFAAIADLVSRHDPDAGDAPPLVRAYLDQNLLQPYFDSSTRDPRFWTMLGLAADHVRLVEFVSAFVREHPSSRTTTELLFMLDEFVQASRDTLLMLLSTNPEVSLAATRAADPEAFAFARSLHDQYSNWADQEGLHDTAAVRARFDEVRMRILTVILDSTPDGYGAGDARFLIGRLLWDRNEVDAAIGWWREITPDGRDSYAGPSSAIVAALRSGGSGRMASINAVLGTEYRRWLTFSEQRLQQFGYAFDSF